jgi:hypothetical protein
MKTTEIRDMVKRGKQELDKSNKDNDDIIEIAWISLQDTEKFDTYTKPWIVRFCKRI